MGSSWLARQARSSAGGGTLGYGFPGGIGAKLAEPNREVVCIAGDGAALYNPQELATLKQIDDSEKMCGWYEETPTTPKVEILDSKESLTISR